MTSLKKSFKYYKRNNNVMAGPSTFSKGPDMFASGVTPFALSHGKGGHVWDVDGNKYIDMIMGLGAINLGYRNLYVEKAIKEQLKKGVVFSLATEKEIEVAEMLCERIPCAEMVRFGKNGNDVTSAAIRLARKVTGKNHVLFCGYHAWQDWYTCQTSMDGGIPKELKRYSHRFNYNDIENLKNIIDGLNDGVACIIMEPISKFFPKKNYLKEVRTLASKKNIILIFDEIVTGFRFDRGGYQNVCKITPDLACFSKAMGNGVPISALVGKKNIMKECTKIFYSLTFAGETLSLAASKATMEFIDSNNVIKDINKKGKYLMTNLEKIISSYKLDECAKIIGYPSKHLLGFQDSNGTTGQMIATYWIQELAKKGILSNGGNTICFAHKDKDIKKNLDIYDDTLKDIQKNIMQNTIEKKLQCKVVKPSPIHKN